MTSFAFIFGCLPLWTATGAGAAARRMLGTAVVSGMLAATLLGVFFIPALFVFVERLVARKSARAASERMTRFAGSEASDPPPEATGTSTRPTPSDAGQVVDSSRFLGARLCRFTAQAERVEA